MAEYRISGVWKDSNDTITHYAFHTKSKEDTYSSAEKVSKATAVSRVEGGNTVKTMIWNYSKAGMYHRETVIVVKDSKGNKFLRSTPDNHVGDNLSNLIDMAWYPIEI